MKSTLLALGVASVTFMGAGRAEATEDLFVTVDTVNRQVDATHASRGPTTPASSGSVFCYVESASFGSTAHCRALSYGPTAPANPGYIEGWCQTTSPELVRAVQSYRRGKDVHFSWDANNNCAYISVGDAEFSNDRKL